MALLSAAKERLSRPLPKDAGFVQELEQLRDDAATTLLGVLKSTTDQTGPPWGSKHISQPQAMQRLEQFEDPAKADYFDQASNAQVAQAAMQAIKLRKQAVKDGSYLPTVPAALPLPQTLPAGPSSLSPGTGSLPPAAAAMPPASLSPGVVSSAQLQTPAPATGAPGPGLPPPAAFLGSGVPDSQLPG